MTPRGLGFYDETPMREKLMEGRLMPTPRGVEMQTPRGLEA
jgi:hypothetical protein